MLFQKIKTSFSNHNLYDFKPLNQEQVRIQEIPNINDLLISIVIPLYNEAHTIKNVINKIPNHFRYEVIVIDDGSIDNSVKNVKKIKNDDYKKIKLIIHEKNKGYGEAILTGFKHAKGDIIITMDSDGQQDPKDILNLIKPILRNQADIVVGSKKMGTCNYKVALHAKMGEFFIKKCLWFLTRQKVNNNQSGFRAFKKNTLELFNEMRFKGMGFTTEILFKAALNNFRIAEVPISNHARKFGNTNVQLKNIIKSIISCILIYFFKKLKMSFNKTFLKNNIGFDKNS